VILCSVYLTARTLWQQLNKHVHKMGAKLLIWLLSPQYYFMLRWITVLMSYIKKHFCSRDKLILQTLYAGPRLLDFTGNKTIKVKKVKGGDITLNWKPISELRSVTCHMGSHSVNCHPTQVNVPRLNPSRIGWYSIYLLQRDGKLSWPRQLVTYRDGLPACRQSPITVPSRPGIE